MTEPILALAVSARDWPDRLRVFLADHGGARVRLTALTVHDLTEEDHDVLVIDDISSMLSRGLVARAHAAGRKVLGVHDPAEPRGRQLLVELGADAVIGCDEGAESFVQAARELGVRVQHRSGRTDPAPVASRHADGKVVEVRGVSGGVGTSEVALALGFALDNSVVVEFAAEPSIAQRIGLALHPNVATAVEVVDHTGGEVGSVLQKAGRTTRVLVGATDSLAAGRGSARRVLDAIRAEARWTVVDGGCIPGAPTPADHTVFVSVASPVGVVRCLDALRARDLANVHVVLNRAPRRAFNRSELLASVLAEIRPRSVTIVPEDSDVTCAAWNGTPVRPSPFTKAVGAVARAVVEAA